MKRSINATAFPAWNAAGIFAAYFYSYSYYRTGKTTGKA